MKKTLCLSLLILFVAACSDGGGSSENPTNETGKGANSNTGSSSSDVSDWQTSTLGQEGHGGDAIVCFNIPVDRALYKVSYGQDNNCVPPGPCSDSSSNKPNSSSGVSWKMTDEGRQSIKSAKPLEQYLAERITSKKLIIDKLNQMELVQGYQKVLSPFTKLPAPFKRLSEMHQKQGWLNEDGIASEYGLADINDSGFLSENEIDKTYCKELQAVVRRDNQLWYDKDIVSHFDNAGRVLIQLHEEIYAWGKAQDKINNESYGPPAHDTSTKTRRLILKLLDENLTQELLNENLKASGFSINYWVDMFKVPTPMGYFMDSDSCLQEQQFLKTALPYSGSKDYWLKVESLFSSRYLSDGSSYMAIQVRYNFPDALSNMIALTYGPHGSDYEFSQQLILLQKKFERPESCQFSF